MVGKSKLSYDGTISQNIVEFEGHPHPLGLVCLDDPKSCHSLVDFLRETIDTSKECLAYDGYCKQRSLGLVELSKTKSYIFTCRPWSTNHQCYFYLHLLCGPLPSIVNDQCHIHNLTLVDSFFENDLDDEFYCDICEEERDPRVCVYCCAKCKFVAHVHCVISKVTEVLTDQREREVQLTVANELTFPEANCDLVDKLKGRSWSSPKEGEYVYLYKLLNLENYIIPEIDKETEILYHMFTSGPRNQKPAYWTVNFPDNCYPKYYEFEHDLLTPFTDWQSQQDGGEYWNDFKGIMSRIKDSFNKDRKLKVKYSNSWVKTVKVGNYMVPWILAPILQILLDHYNGIHPSTLTEKMVNLGYISLCTLIHSMSKTRVRYLNENLLRDWFCQAMSLKCLGFEIDFVFRRLKQVSYAYFKLRLQFETSKMMAKEIENLNQKIAHLELEIAKAKLEKAKWEAEFEGLERISWEQSSTKSNFLNMCFKEASILEGKYAGQDLIK